MLETCLQGWSEAPAELAAYRFGRSLTLPSNEITGQMLGDSNGLFDHFLGGFEGSKWYYTAFIDAISDRIEERLFTELRKCLYDVFGEGELRGRQFRT